MKKTLILILPVLILLGKVHASDCYDECPQESKVDCCEQSQNKAYDQGHEICAEVMQKGYNAPARIDICDGWDAYVTASFLYWEPLADQLDTNYTLDTTAVPQQFTTLKFDTDYQPGFKVGLGYNFNYDNWDLYAEYTRVHETKTNRYTVGSNDLLFNVLLMLNGPYAPTTNVTSTWKVYYDKIDLELARAYYVGTKLSFRPYFGASVLWLDQTYTNEFVDTETQRTSMKTDSWSLGPRAGLYASWMLGNGFRLFGEATLNLMFSSNKTSGQELSSVVPLGMDFVQVKHYLIRDGEEAQIGFGWGSYFSNDQWHLDLAVAYEAQRYSNTNYWSQIAQVSSLPGLTTTLVKAGNFYIHGLTVSARVDF